LTDNVPTKYLKKRNK